MKGWLTISSTRRSDLVFSTCPAPRPAETCPCDWLLTCPCRSSPARCHRPPQPPAPPPPPPRGPARSRLQVRRPTNAMPDRWHAGPTPCGGEARRRRRRERPQGRADPPTPSHRGARGSGRRRPGNQRRGGRRNAARAPGVTCLRFLTWLLPSTLRA